MTRIKHIAIRTPDPEKTAAFYKDVLGLKEVGQARTGCYLSDGYINLAVLKSRDEGTAESPRDEPGNTVIIASQASRRAVPAMKPSSRTPRKSVSHRT